MPGSKGYSRSFFKVNEIIHCCSGLWIFERGEVSRLWKIARFLYSSTIYGIIFCFLLVQIAMFKETVKEIGKLISHLEMVTSHVLGFLKLVTLRIHYGKLQKVLDVLQNENLYYDPEGDFKPWMMFCQGKRVSQFVSITVAVLYSFVGIVAYISGKVKIDLDMKDTHFAANSTCYDYLTYYFYIPFPSDTKRKCEVAILFMGYSLMAWGWVIASHDALYVSLVNCLNTHFVIVGEAIRTIRKRVVTRIGLPEDIDVFHDEELPQLEAELYKELKRISQHLFILLEVAVDLEATFHLILLGQLIISLISPASSLFVANTVPTGSGEYFTQVQYFVALLVQLGLFCAFGEMIRTSVLKSSISYYTVFKTINE